MNSKRNEFEILRRNFQLKIQRFKSRIKNSPVIYHHYLFCKIWTLKSKNCQLWAATISFEAEFSDSLWLLLNSLKEFLLIEFRFANKSWLAPFPPALYFCFVFIVSLFNRSAKESMRRNGTKESSITWRKAIAHWHILYVCVWYVFTNTVQLRMMYPVRLRMIYGYEYCATTYDVRLRILYSYIFYARACSANFILLSRTKNSANKKLVDKTSFSDTLLVPKPVLKHKRMHWKW